MSHYLSPGGWCLTISNMVDDTSECIPNPVEDASVFQTRWESHHYLKQLAYNLLFLLFPFNGCDAHFSWGETFDGRPPLMHMYLRPRSAPHASSRTQVSPACVNINVDLPIVKIE